MQTILRWHGRMQAAINWLIAAALMGLLCVILLQTFTRYVLFYSLPWSEELSRYLFVLMILLGLNIGVSRGIMVRIDLIDSVVPEGAKRWMELFREGVALVVASCFLYSSLGMVRIGAFQRSPAMQIRMNIVYCALLAGFVLAVLAIVLNIVGKIIEIKEGR